METGCKIITDNIYFENDKPYSDAVTQQNEREPSIVLG